jgi:Protein of unknown function (DUF642)/PEP-CTERM motif
MKRILFSLAALGLLSVGTVKRAHASNIVVNGGFEAPVVSGFYYTIYSAGQSFTGWTIGRGSVALGTNQFNPGQSDLPYQGNQYLQLASTQGGNGSIYQDLATTPGTTYELSFAFASNPFASENVTMNVAWGGTPVANLSATPSHELLNSGWVVESFSIVATQKTTRLEFTNTTPIADIAGPQIDAVIVSSVPEPSSMVMGLIGLTMAGGVVLVRPRSDG